jgi:hypothetical protein
MLAIQYCPIFHMNINTTLSQDIHKLLNELEIEHKTTIYELEAAYEAKRRSLLRKLRNNKEQVK